MIIKKKYNRNFLNKDSNMNIITGSLLILLLSTVLSSSPVNIMNKKTLQMLRNKHIIVDYLLILCFIYFVIDFTYNDTKSPLFELGISLLILCLYIGYTKLDYKIQSIIFLLLIMLYFLNDTINYIKNNNSNHGNNSNKLVLYAHIKKTLLLLFIISIGMGCFVTL
jgi:hypothetical protein